MGQDGLIRRLVPKGAPAVRWTRSSTARCSRHSLRKPGHNEETLCRFGYSPAFTAPAFLGSAGLDRRSGQ